MFTILIIRFLLRISLDREDHSHSRQCFATRCIFNSLLVVWKFSETLSFVFELLHETDKVLLKHVHMQGCGLRKITRSPKAPNHEILGAQHLSLYENSKFFQLPKDKS